MHHSTQLLYVVRNTPAAGNTPVHNTPAHNTPAHNTPAESFGRIARSMAAATPVLLAPARPSANDPEIDSRELCDASARRALAASGFGCAAVHGAAAGHTRVLDETPLSAPVAVPAGVRRAVPSATQPEAAARAERSRRLGDIEASIWRPVAHRLQVLLTRLDQRLQARGTYLALRELDARTLRDIGVDRSEILSVALELSGAFQTTRVHTTRTPRSR